MEGFSDKIKKAVVYGGMVLGMAQAYDKLKDHNENAIGRDDRKTEKVTDAASRDNQNDTVEYAGVESNYQIDDSSEDGEISPEEQDEEAQRLRELNKLQTNLEDGSLIDPKNLTNLEDQEKTWLINYMESPGYLKKALKEGLTKKDVEDRIARLKKTPIFEHDKEKLKDGEWGERQSIIDHDTQEELSIINIAKKNPSRLVKSIKVHEAQHAATLGNEFISQKAKELYDESFKGGRYSNGDAPNNNYKNYEEYLRETTERDARKRQLEYEAEQLGILQVGQQITKKDYKQILRAYKKGQFTEGARQFIETTKPEYFLRIMNEIAENESNDSVPDNLPVEHQA